MNTSLPGPLPTVPTLDNRAKAILFTLGFGIHDKEQFAKALRDDEIILSKIRNCGRETELQMYHWAGLSIKPVRFPFKCPHCEKIIRQPINTTTP